MRNEKVLKLEKFGWRDIVTFFSYFAIMFFSVFLVTFILIAVHISMNSGDLNQAMEQNLLDISIWGTLLSGISTTIIVCILYWEMIVDSWKRFWGKWKKNIFVIIIGYIVIMVFEMLFSTFISTESSANQETIEQMFANATTLQVLALQR